MAITKPKPAPTVEAFIGGAPDASARTRERKGIWKGYKRQISLTISPELLKNAESRAEEYGITRTAFICMAIQRMLMKEND